MTAASEIVKLLISSKSMVTAFDEEGKPVAEYTGPLAEIGPKLKAAFPAIKISWGDMTPQLAGIPWRQSAAKTAIGLAELARRRGPLTL